MSSHFPPLGRLVKVNGHHLHLHTLGEGSPTVIFEAGAASWSLDWHLVQTEVAQFTRACSYDRAGFGWSEPGPKPRTTVQMVKELHTLLTEAGLQKPYIFVGASFGGHPIRLYTKTYPDDVVGIILLDARHETVNTKMPPAWRQMEFPGKVIFRFMLAMSKLGILNMMGRFMKGNALPPVAKILPSEMLPKYLTVGYRTNYWQTNLDELAASADSDAQVMASGSLGNVPLTVIRHSRPDLFAQMPAQQAQQAEQVWQELQMELTQLSTNSRMLVAEKSGHGIQFEQPDLVVEVIRQMVENARGALSSSPFGKGN